MPAGGRLTERTRIRRLNTGEPFAAAKAALKSSDTPELIPVAHGTQALLESRIMMHLATGGQYWAHPLGIKSVRLLPSQTIVELDSHTYIFGTRQAYSMSQYAAERVLPFAEPGIQVSGAPGVRIAAIRGRDLHLSLADSESRLILRAPGDPQWKKIIQRHWESLNIEKFAPLWDSTSLTTHERQDDMRYLRVRQHERDLAWLGSGLLRRIALLYTSSHSYSARSWITEAEWVFEMDSIFGVSVNHDSFLKQLIGQTWALPLRVEEKYCSCHFTKRRRHREDLQCTFHLVHRDPSYRGGLQIRFRAMGSGYGADMRRHFEDVGAKAVWLDRVFGNRLSSGTGE